MKQANLQFGRLRHSLLPRWLSVFAILLHALFTAEFASARAAAAMAGDNNGASFGFFEICTANGIVRVGLDHTSDESEKPKNSICPLCGAFQNGDAFEAFAAHELTTPDWKLVSTELAPPNNSLKIKTPFRPCWVRGPPPVPST